jgi:hypothetical protein
VRGPRVCYSSRVQLSDEVRVMFRPFATHRRALDEVRVGWRALVVRPVLVAGVNGLAVTLSAAGELFPTLWLGSALTWAWAPALQMLLAAPLIVLARALGGSRLRLSSALDLFFLGHGPWSLWLMGAGVALGWHLPNTTGFDFMPVARTIVVPIVWTVLLVFAFFRVGLGLSRAKAVLLTLLYQGLLWGCVYLYVGVATYRLWPFNPYARSWNG